MLGSFLQNSRASPAVPPSISKSSNRFSRLLNHIVRNSQKTIRFLVPGMRYVSFCLCYFILHCCYEYLREHWKRQKDVFLSTVIVTWLCCFWAHLWWNRSLAPFWPLRTVRTPNPHIGWVLPLQLTSLETPSQTHPKVYLLPGSKIQSIVKINHHKSTPWQLNTQKNIIFKLSHPTPGPHRCMAIS